MSDIKRFEDLRVYKVSLVLLERIYIVAYKIPHLKLRTQLIKSAEAIAPLIAEGFTRKRNPVDAARFYEMAMVESDEETVHLAEAIILSKHFKQIPVEECESLIKEYTSLSKQLNRLSTIWRGFSSKNTLLPEKPKTKTQILKNRDLI
ncbi:four helix bundle protein [Candidatus Microgenomates bacterium]|nr:four helix bundle protein [Candidatus Microgenomates bacterium]